MEHADPVAWLFSLHTFGMKLGLDNIRALTEALGRPQDRFHSILVAGTNGKGSTAAMLHSILTAAGMRSGLYTSPHLVRIEERIRLGEAEIAGDELAAILSLIRVTIDGLREDGRLAATPTFFEVITAAALLAYARGKVEVAVLEVGLGGRLDATNIVTPVLSVITSIDRDHQEQLGGTLDAIAREKAGILRAGVTGLVGEVNEEALAAIRETAAQLGSPIVLATDGSRIDSATRSPRARTRAAQIFSVSTPVETYSNLACPLPGLHQQRNALIAIRAAELLSAAPPGRRGARTEPPVPLIDGRAIREGIASAHWPGRLEWVEGKPALLLDGAHNPAGCRALADYLASRSLRPVLIFAAMRDKEIEPMLGTLLPRVSASVFTAPPAPRAASPDALVDIARKVYRGLGPPTGAAVEMSPIHHPAESLLVADGGRFIADGDVASALARARGLAGPAGTVLVAGSLFLVGAIKEVLQGLPVRAGESGL